MGTPFIRKMLAPLQRIEPGDLEPLLPYVLTNLTITLYVLVVGLGCLAAVHDRSAASPTATSHYTGLSAWVMALALGAALIITETFLIALFGVLYREVVVGFALLNLGLAGFLCVFYRHRLSALCRPAPGSFSAWEAAVLILAVGLFLFYSQASVRVSDATSYHLPYARFYVEQHGLAVNEALRYPLHTHNINLLYSLLFVLDGNILHAQALHGLFGAWLGLATWALARQLGLPGLASVLAGWAMLTLGLMQRIQGVALVDNGGVFFLTAAVLGLFAWNDRRAKPMLWVSAVCLGLGMGTKYLYALYSLPIGAYLLWQSRSFKLLFSYAGLTAVFGLWWYIRNAVIAGNPVHPFALEIFGEYLWTVGDQESQMRNLNTYRRQYADVPIWQLPVLFRTVPPLIWTGLFPWLCALYAVPLAWKGLTANQRWLFAFVVPYLVFWFYTTYMFRYLLPLCPYLLVLVLAAAMVFWRWVLQGLDAVGARCWPAHRRWSLRQGVLASSALAVAWLVLAGAIIGHSLHPLYRVSKTFVPAEQVGTNDTLSRIPGYQLVQAANRAFTPEDTVYFMGYRQLIYFFDGHAIGDAFGPYRTRGLWTVPGTWGRPDILEKRLREFGAVGLIMRPNASRLKPYLDEYNQVFERLYHNENGAVYRLR